MAAKSGSNIQFNYFKTTFRLPEPTKTAGWVERVLNLERLSVSSLSYIFCTDSYLLGINKKYLNHDTLTDIITFDYSEEKSMLEAEIYISVPRVKENARKLGVDFDMELHRVIIHGVLHLAGYGDKGVEKKEMRKREDRHLAIRFHVERG
jgi:rRNA maturation RNase YbeY